MYLPNRRGGVCACSLTNNPLGLPLTQRTSPRPRWVQELGGWDYLDYRWIEWAMALSVRPRPSPLRSVLLPNPGVGVAARGTLSHKRAHYSVLRQGSMLHAAHIAGWLVSGSKSPPVPRVAAARHSVDFVSNSSQRTPLPPPTPIESPSSHLLPW
jgi:hypothetical protein